MERDKHISKLIRESGIEAAPDGFTREVMGRIQEGKQGVYKPLFGKRSGLLVLILIAVVAVAAVLLAGTGEEPQAVSGFLQSTGWSWPSLQFDLSFLSDMNNFAWLVPTVAAIFLLVLSDVGLFRKRAA